MKFYQLAERKTFLQDNDVAVTAVDEVTKFPEILDGRVKTLNPMIHGDFLRNMMILLIKHKWKNTASSQSKLFV